MNEGLKYLLEFLNNDFLLTRLNPDYKKTLISDNVCVESIDDEKRALEQEIQQIDAVLHRIIPKSVYNANNS